MAELISRMAAVTQSHTNGMLIQLNRTSRGKIMTLPGGVYDKATETLP